jgi:hypothetical protein
MLICPFTRDQLLGVLPKGGRVAEIGVAEGEFSQSILEACQPRQLTLIDPWEHQGRDDYQLDTNNVTQADQDRRHDAVRSRFAEAIGRDQVRLLRAYSQDAVDEFEDGALDWVYIDGLHSLAGALSDLRDYGPKVAEDGLILGHDFANHPAARQMQFGVVEAVAAYVAETGYKLLLITNETYPTFVLAKAPNGPTASRLLAGIYMNVPFLVEIEDWQTLFQQRVIQIGPHQRVIPGA